MRTFVISDIHGDMPGLESIIKQLSEGFEMNLLRDRLVFLGDYVDGYPHSKQVIRYIRVLETTFKSDHVVCLRGNHEQLLIDGHDKPQYDMQFRLWFEQGGHATAASYEAQFQGRSVYLSIPDDMKSDIQWMSKLRYWFEDDYYYYVHAGFRPGQPVIVQDPYDMLWIRNEFIRSDYDFGKMVIFGHTAVDEPIIHPTKIQMDTRYRGKGYISAAEIFPDKPPIFIKSS